MLDEADFEQLRTVTTAVECMARLDWLLARAVDRNQWARAVLAAAGHCWDLGALAEAELLYRRILDGPGDWAPSPGSEGRENSRLDAMVNLTLVLLDLGRTDAADLAPEAAGLLLSLGYAFDALTFCGRVIAALPTVAPEALANLLQTATDAGKQAPRDEDLLGALWEVGHAAYVRGELHASLALFSQAMRVARARSNDDALLKLGANIVTIGALAEEWLRVAQVGSEVLAASSRGESDDERIPLIANTAFACAQIGRGAEAVGLLRGLLSRGDLAPELRTASLTTLAEALLDLKSFDEAAATLEVLRELGSTDVGLDRRLVSEREGGLRLDCSHRVLSMVLWKDAARATHGNAEPVDPLDPEAHEVPGVSSEDRIEFDALWHSASSMGAEAAQLVGPRRVSPSGEYPYPGALVVAMNHAYTDDLTDFEHRWHLYREERRGRELRRVLRERWGDLQRRDPPSPGQQREVGTDEHLAMLVTLVDMAVALAESGQRDSFSRVAYYAADLLEIWVSSELAAAFFWTQRAKLVNAARVIGGANVPQCGIEVRRSFEQFTRLLDRSEPDVQALLYDRTLPAWVTMASDPGSGIAPGVVAGLGLGRGLDLDPQAEVQLGVALSMAGDHAAALETMETALARARSDHGPEAAIWLDGPTGIALAAARFNTRCNDTRSCHDAYGPFAAYIHAELSRWDLAAFPLQGIEEAAAATARVGPIAFTDENLVVFQRGFPDDAWALATVHEAEHALFRKQQVMRLPDSRWVRVKRDLPTASATTYQYALDPAVLGLVSGTDALPGLEEVRRLAKVGEDAASSDTQNAGKYVGNMLAYFDALSMGRQETPASYSCGALLVGVIRALVREHAPATVHTYLEYLRLVDHDEALALSRSGAGPQA